MWDQLCTGIRRIHLGEESLPYGWHALPGGMNNGIYALKYGGQRYCAKCYKVDGRLRDRREWDALSLLASAAPGLAARPVFYDSDPVVPIVIMEYIDGEPLGGQSLTPAQSIGLGSALRQLYAVGQPEYPDYPWTVVSPVPKHVERVHTMYLQAHADYIPGNDQNPPEVVEAHDLCLEWLNSADPALLKAPAPQTFSRGDPNLANCLWDGGKVRLVDLEYAGWSDRAFEIADLIEHPQSYATTERTWVQFVAGFGFSETEEARYLAARCLVALFWLLRFWGDPVRFGTCLQRVKRLLISAR